ncbi:hypothetical protein CAEBREN_00118 [Caenorhabditis brenneri]|uniref:RING-type domain-containing protein n=1 Tax=Caenorhabditis brenneri TaxID=135651 RepID=G0MUQ8_CAEBE|nr:hypothetical protein CAEBREN_00118 [Caenorhabditis brenneri]
MTGRRQQRSQARQFLSSSFDPDFQYKPVEYTRENDPIEVVCMKLQTWFSTLKDVKMEEEVEQTTSNTSFYTDRSQLYDAEIIPSTSQGTNQSTIIKIEDIQTKWKEELGRIRVESWMKNAVLYPIGPEYIEKIEKNKINLHDLTYRIIIDHKMNLALLAVKLIQQSVEKTTRLIEKALAKHSQSKDLLISQPASAFGIKLEYGQNPRIVDDPKETQIAVIFDEEYQRGGAVDPDSFYEDRLGCRIVSSRALDEPERRFIEGRLGKCLGSRPLRLLEFQSPEDRNWAVSHGSVEALDLFYDNTQFDHQTPQESIKLTLKYNFREANLGGVEVTLSDKRDKTFLYRVMHQHSLWARSDSNDKACLKMFVTGFDCHADTYEQREEIVRRILYANHILVENMQEFIKPSLPENRTTIPPIDLKKLVENELRLIVTRFQGLHPWTVHRQNMGSNQEVEHLTVEFDSFADGRKIVKEVLRLSQTRHTIFVVEGVTIHEPEIRPTFRKTIAISRSIRVALDQTIRRFDLKLRSKVDENEDNFCLRVHEEWSDGLEAGIIGIEGWPQDAVKDHFLQLKALLKPKTFEGCTSLMFGAGEIFAKSLQQKYKGSLIVEVDKHTEEVKLIGEAAGDAIQDLQNYPNVRNETWIRCKIPIQVPVFNTRIRYMLADDVVEDLKSFLGVSHLAHDWEKMALEFEGSIAKYEELLVLLKEMSMEVFKKETMGMNMDGIPEECPTCGTALDEMEDVDFYRLQCGHTTCRQCLNSKVKNISAEKFRVECDVERCGKFITPSDILNVILGSPRAPDSSKLRPLILQAKATLSNAMPCTSSDCNGILVKSPGDLLDYKSCKACSRLYCRECLMEPHEGHSCEDYGRIRATPDASVQEYMNKLGEGRVKKCPKCWKFVEKDFGCGHIHCHCGAHFCWLCLFVGRDSQAVTNHLIDEHVHIHLEQEPREQGGPILFEEPFVGEVNQPHQRIGDGFGLIGQRRGIRRNPR